MKRLAMAGLILGAAAMVGCTVSETRRDDPRYIGGDPNVQYAPTYPPGYAPPAPVYPQGPGYVETVPVQPVYPPGSYVEPYPGRVDPGRVDPGRVNPGNNRPPALPPVNAALVRAGDSLVSSIDQYVQSIASLNSPDFTQMRGILGPMRTAADNFRNSARSGLPTSSLRGAADDLLLRFQAANAIYGRLVATNRGYTSGLFGKISDYTVQIVQSTRK